MSKTNRAPGANWPTRSRKSERTDMNPAIALADNLSLPAVERNNLNTKFACELATVGIVHEGNVSEGVGAHPSIKTEQVGKLSRIVHFQRLETARKQPGNCGRCGKPNGNGHANCDRCRNYQTLYKRRLHAKRLSSPSGMMSELAQFRRELSRLRATVKNMANERRASYRKGYAAGLAGKRVRFRRGAYIPPQISKQELATMNHAYDHDS